MTSDIYASLCAFTIVWLSLQVIWIRPRDRVNISDGGNEQLRVSKQHRLPGIRRG